MWRRARPDGDEVPRDFNDFEVAARESVDAFHDGKLWGFIRHARISEEQACEFWERMAELVAEFDRLRVGRHDVRLRGRRLPHRPADPADGLEPVRTDRLERAGAQAPARLEVGPGS